MSTDDGLLVQIYVDVIRQNGIPPSIEPVQLAKLVRISEAFERTGTDDMLCILETKAVEVSWLLVLLSFAVIARELLVIIAQVFGLMPLLPFLQLQYSAFGAIRTTYLVC